MPHLFRHGASAFGLDRPESTRSTSSGISSIRSFIMKSLASDKAKADESFPSAKKAGGLCSVLCAWEHVRRMYGMVWYDSHEGEGLRTRTHSFYFRYERNTTGDFTGKIDPQSARQRCSGPSKESLPLGVWCDMSAKRRTREPAKASKHLCMYICMHMQLRHSGQGYGRQTQLLPPYTTTIL